MRLAGSLKEIIEDALQSRRGVDDDGTVLLQVKVPMA